MNYEGILGFYKGLTASFLLSINQIIQIIFYEFLKQNFNDKNRFLLFASSAFSMALSTFLTYPYQVIRTNLHVNLFKIIYILKLFKIR